MTTKNIIKLILTQLLILISIESFSQDIHKPYDNQKATVELNGIAKKIKNGSPYKINPNLVQYIYTQQDKFPEIPANSNSRTKMGILAPTYAKINLILKSQLNQPQDSISKEQAMLAASIGYQSIKIISLSNDFIKSLSKDSYNYKTRVRGYNQGIKGLQELLTGYITMTFLENKNQEVDDILISSLRNFAPKIINKFPEDKKEHTIELLKALIKGKEDIRLKNEFTNFMELL
ncbi:hypothetical protein VBY74_00705 [Tenacibaculum ascidiaceicola]|uniref:hypothetical protein n=1 Tax=Tenacibaculum ascidiaceicola TaxID=1699411 RepID=UPI0039ED1F67